jgi:cytochrome b involved in lipid metabolism
MKIYISVFLLAVVLSLGGCFKKEVGNSEQEKNVDVIIPGEVSGEELEIDNSQPGEVKQVEYDLSEIAKHDNAEDCWLLIDDKIYDVTSFIAGGKHGGGDAILEGCGINATELYKTRPMGSGTEHSEKAYGFLEGFFIANLKK